LDEVLTPRQAFSVLDVLDEYEWIWAPLIFTALAVFTRMWKIGLSPIVTWDEAQYVMPFTALFIHI
jgi:dolichyl-phosphate-mannose--protein O-mannosyl transferase